MAKRNNEDEPRDENINNDADDTFGLPEVEYEPLKRDEPIEEPVAEEPVYERPVYSEQEQTETPVTEERDEYYEEQDQYEEEPEHTYQSQYVYQEEKSSVWPKVVLIVLLIFAAAGALFYFAYYAPRAEKEAAARAMADRQRDAEAKARADRQRAEEARLELERQAEQRRADSLANLNRVGSIERLSGRTGQYYVVVASAVDDDLLMDFANKLVKQGRQVRVIPPFGKDPRFHRLAIEARDNYADAQSAADALKGGDFGDQLWVVKY